MKPLHLSRHARRRMRRHEVSEDDVRAVLLEPDDLVPTVRGRMNATKAVAGRINRVTYGEEEARTVIVTVTPRRRT